MVSHEPDFKPESVSLVDLKPHPRNYVVHPADQIGHLIESIREHKFYRNIVIARDGTILAGHGVVEACRKMGLERVPAIRLDIDPNEPRALKVLAGDNEIAHLREIDDRALTEILKEIKDFDVDGLLGTGYDAMMLANLVFVTRPQSEIQDFNEAAEWVGMPEYEEGSGIIQAVINFKCEEDRLEFGRILGLRISDKKVGRGSSYWWPAKGKDDLASIRFEGAHANGR